MLSCQLDVTVVKDGIFVEEMVMTIEPFRLGRDNWEQYIERFEQYVDDDQRVATSLTVIRS